MDYYSTLGLTRGASEDDIKKAYRSMAMKHHPDRGGDEKKFKEIEEAYRTLSDPQKKQMIDQGMDPNAQQGFGGGFHQRGPFEFHFGSGNFNDIFGNFGFGNSSLRRNKSVSINIQISLEDVLNGKDIDAEITLPNGKKKLINIAIPPGVEHGQQIKYSGMGESTVPNVKPGDLIVNVHVAPHAEYQREGVNLVCEKKISVWDALLGTSVDIVTVDKKTLNINIPAGTQPDTVFSCRSEGMPQMRTKQRGNLLIRIKVEIPKMLNDNQKELINRLKDGR
jgi:DnaJ-class molecular chaperone